MTRIFPLFRPLSANHRSDLPSKGNCAEQSLDPRLGKSTSPTLVITPLVPFNRAVSESPYIPQLPRLAGKSIRSKRKESRTSPLFFETRSETTGKIIFSTDGGRGGRRSRGWNLPAESGSGVVTTSGSGGTIYHGERASPSVSAR